MHVRSRPLPRPIALALALLVVTACATTQEAGPRKAPRSPTFFWKVTSSDKPGTVYLLGTVHLGDPKAATLDRAVLDAVDGADRLVFEVVPDETNEQQVMALTQELGLLPEGESLFTQVDEETKAALERAAQKVGMPTAGLERMRPWLAALALSVMRMQLAGYSQEAGVERLLLARVRLAGEKPAHSLETAEEQLRLFAGLTPEMQVQMLSDAVKDLDKARERVDQITAAYQGGDDAALLALLFEDRGTDPAADAFYRAVFDERNARMVERLEPWFDEGGSTVVAVGAGHMLGEQGIPALLAAKGFHVEAVPALGLAPVRPEGSPAAGAFVDEELGFSADFHATPQVMRQQMTTPDGHPADFVAVTANEQLLELSVVVNRFPVALDTDPARLDPLFGAMLERMGQQFGGLESSERLTVQGLPAARFTARSPTHLVTGLVVLRGARMYTVLASRGGEADGSAHSEREAAVQRFLESFRLLDEPVPEG